MTPSASTSGASGQPATGAVRYRLASMVEPSPGMMLSPLPGGS
jgi:hypothetical protein